MNYFESEGRKPVDNFLEIVIGFIVGAFVGSLMTIQLHKTNTQTEKPAIIDSLITVNDSIKIKVEKLDSIKNAKVIEVQTLDNDSTLKLFYELVSE